MNDLVYISAGEALDRFRSRDLSPVELMTAVIERSQEVEPRVNAFAEEHFEEALELADERRGENAAEQGPHGRSKASRSQSKTTPLWRASGARRGRCSERTMSIPIRHRRCSASSTPERSFTPEPPAPSSAGLGTVQWCE